MLIGLEVNADKTKYVIMSRDQNAGRSHSMKIDNSSIERVEEFKYLGTALTYQTSIQEEIKSRMKLGNACYYLGQNLLSSSLLSKNLKINCLGYLKKYADSGTRTNTVYFRRLLLARVQLPGLHKEIC